MKRILLSALLLAVCFFVSGEIKISAQETRGSIYGTVTDQNAAVIQGAIVTVVQKTTNLRFTATTNREGFFRVPLLPIGDYEVNIAAQNFKSFGLNDLNLRIGEEKRLDVSLNVPSASASVTIESPPLTESSTAALATVIPAERVASLPLNGRQIQELALTAPGVSASGGFRSSAFNQFGLATPADGNGGAFSVNGAGSRSNGFFLDGSDINIPEQGVIAFPPAVEAIKEFQIQTNNFAAEYGRYSGSIVNFATKQGTNDFRGSVYEFFRNDVLDANDPFNKAAGLPRSVLKQNQFGATGGGAIIKNRLFIFGNYEGNYVRQGTGAFTSNLPTAEQRNGILRYRDAGGNQQTLTVAPNRISAAILDGFIPLPNAATSGANYIANGTNRLNEDIYTVRVDARFSDKDLLTARYTYDNQRQFFPFDIFFVSASLPAFPFPNPEKRTSYVTSYTRTITPNFINEFRFGFNYQENPIPNGNPIDPASIGLPNGAPQNDFGTGLPVIRITGFGGTGGQPFTDNLGASFTNRQVFQFIDNVTIVRGNHTIKTGIELRRTRVNSNAFRPLRGSLNFNGSRNGVINPAITGNAAVAALADFLLGLPAQTTISSADPNRVFETKTLNAFVQDEWRFNQRLTLSFGLRYEIDTPLTDVGNRLANLIPGVGNFVVGSNELPRLHRLDKNNFAPRFGFAYLLTGDGKNVIRGGGGVFYDNGVFQDRFGTARTNAPFAITNIDNNPAAFPATGNATTFTRLLGSGAATGAASIDTNFRTAYAVQYNLNFQREILKNTVAEIAYVGRSGVNLSRQVNINQIVAVNSPQAQIAPVGSRPFAGLNIPVAARFANDIVQQQSTAHSNYNALQVKIERRLSRGTSFLLAYTYSKSLDDASGIGTGNDDRPQDSYNLRGQRAVSNFDIPHRFVFSSTFAVPIGRGQRFLANVPKFLSFLISDWQTNSISTVQSGQPFNVTVGSFDALTGIANRRPNLVGNPNENVPDGFAFNPAAFIAPPAGQLGNAGRNIVRGGSYFNTDFAVLRNFALPMFGEAGSLQFRAEFFNLYNNVNFTAPVTSLSNAAFGRFVSNATAPRVIQFGVKIGF
jgi:hypothetical protein